MRITFCDRCGLLTHERKRPNGEVLCDDCFDGKPPKRSHAADSQMMTSVTAPSDEAVMRIIRRNLKKDERSHS